MLSNGGSFAEASSYGSSGANAAGTLAGMPAWLSASRFTLRPGQR